MAILVVAAALSPGLIWRTDPPPWPRSPSVAPLVLAKIPAGTPDDWPAGLAVAGVWELTSRSSLFGGYSALLSNGHGVLTAYSDSAMTLRFAAPGSGVGAPARFARVRLAGKWKAARDLEAATSDPATGRHWYAFEMDNRIERFSPSGAPSGRKFPPAMADWPENGGPEAMVRLADRRFIVLREDAGWLSAGERTGLLFPSDPVEGARPLEFTFRPPIGYSPSDMAALPDGRVMILLRALDPPLPPLFRSKLLVADPREIEADNPWPWQELATLHGPVPRDNYEGLAIVPDKDGVTMWLISDDNHVPFQRTLLLELRWQGVAAPATPGGVTRRRRPS